MNELASSWNNLPASIDPIAFSIGFFSVRWYSLMIMLALVSIYALLRWRFRKKEGQMFGLERDSLDKLFIYVVLGLLIGSRIGYVVFYDPWSFLDNPLSIISPFTNGAFVGFYGLSFHGGLAGAIAGGLMFCKKHRLSIVGIANFVIPTVPLGIFFGRIGNFLNSELYGRPTDSPIGMYFPPDQESLLRHPSQLYEAVLEGLVIFLILWPLRNCKKMKDKLLPLFLVLYGTARFIAEFFRQPDPQLGLVLWDLTMGQILSLALIAIGTIILLSTSKNEPGRS